MDNRIEKEYQALWNERIEIQAMLSTLVQGYISKKRIGGKQYCYLQQRQGSKVSSAYIPATNVDQVQDELRKRKEYTERLAAIDSRMEQIEKAAALIGGPERRKISQIKLSAGMDGLSIEDKEKSASFAAAMNAIEGVPVSSMTESALAEWICGKKAYSNILTLVLQHYGFSEETL